jgi:uncharacterized protein
MLHSRQHPSGTLKEPGMSHAELYAEAGENARFTHPVAAPFLVIAFMAVAAILGVIGSMVSGTVYGAIAGTSGVVPDQSAVMPVVMLFFLLTFFPSFALMAVLWSRLYEGRSLASLGFRGFMPFLYAVGLVAGVVFAVVLTIIGGILATQFGAEGADWGNFSTSILNDQDFLVFLAIVALVFFVQSASEEIVVRGWLFSTLFARTSLFLSVLVSSLTFGVLHGDRVFLDIGVGVASIIALSFVGAFLALWAARERSVWGVCGIHGGFNATLICLSFIGLYIEADGQKTGGQLVMDVIESLQEQMSDPSAIPLAGAQLVLFGVATLLMWPLAKKALAARQQ